MLNVLLGVVKYLNVVVDFKLWIISGIYYLVSVVWIWYGYLKMLVGC